MISRRCGGAFYCLIKQHVTLYLNAILWTALRVLIRRKKIVRLVLTMLLKSIGENKAGFLW
jgi:hypothetical protein